MSQDKPHAEILLVEDNEEDAALVIRSLRQYNLLNELLHLRNGAQALDFIFGVGEYAGRNTSDLPRLILLDLKMPKVDGLQVLKVIRENERTKLVPVVIMTSSGEDRDVVESYKLGVNSYIVKPVEFENFAKAVADLGMYWLMLNEAPKP